MKSVFDMSRVQYKEGPRGKEGLQGPKGEPGEPGKRGEKGDQGFRGFDGPDGPTGMTGPTGYTGYTGYTGPIGTGPTGSTGPQGPRGEQGEFGGPTGPTGLQGFTGPTGPMSDHVISIIYNDFSLYKIKLMQDCRQITQNTELCLDLNLKNNINIGIGYATFLTNAEKYINNINLSKDDYTLTFYISTSYPVKCLFMTTLGQHYSVPTSFSKIDMLSEYYVKLSFDFDSQEAFEEYVDLGIVYDLQICWF
jgi:hypothetical protein